MYKKKILSTSLINTAVLLIVFNRPDTTIQSLNAIRKAKPQRLYIAGDGPRNKTKSEIEKINKVRQIVKNIDWPCEVKTLFRDKNLGCKKGVSSAITWFFEHEDKGIIIEDDCLPNLEFFTFCENLLIHYANDDRISLITGDNFQRGYLRGNDSYYFSKYCHCWGWATWRRSWINFQDNIPFWPEWSKSKAWLNYLPDKVERKYWQNIFERVYLNQIDSWAYPWTCCNWKLGKISIAPNVNLVKNIGFGREDATHTKSGKHPSSNLKTFSINGIKHPKKVQRNLEADTFDFNYHFEGKNLRFPYFIVTFIKKLIYSVLKISKKINYLGK